MKQCRANSGGGEVRVVVGVGVCVWWWKGAAWPDLVWL
jgi:hypothetical protein